MPSDALALSYPPVELTPAEYRRICTVDLMQAVSQGHGARSGLHPGGGAKVTNTGMTINVLDLKGVVYVPTPDATVGAWRFALPARTHTVPTADGSNPRKDIVYVRVWDHVVDGDSLYEADTVYLAGTPSGTPTAPTVPANKQAFRIATIDVPAGSSSPTVTYDSPYIVSNGGILPIRNTGERPAAGLYAGMACYQIDIASLIVYNGSAWIVIGEPVTSTSTGMSSAADWLVTWDVWRGQGGFASGVMNVARTGSDLPASSATGNFSPDLVVGTVPSGWRPATTWDINGGNGAAGPWNFSVATTGVISLRSGTPDYTITSSTGQIRIGFNWKIA